MRINEQYGSKGRLFEMMNKVNKVSLNETYFSDQLMTTLEEAYEKLKSGALTPEQGGSVKSSMQNVNDFSYVGINGFDRNKNMYNFNFKISASQEDQQDDVFNVDEVVLEKFYYQNPKGEKVFDVNEDDLREFNQKHDASELYDVVEKYMDTEEIETPEEEIAEGEEDPCWDSHEMVGMKEKGGKEVPNCVPKNEEEESFEVPVEPEQSLDPEDENENGDRIEGGLGDDADVGEFDPDQILKGIEIEMEHTSDPRVALEVAMDHLMELPRYYDRLEDMEKEAEMENSEDSEDKETENALLGFDTETPNASEDYDFAAQERGYTDKDVYNTDNQRKEQLWDKLFSDPNGLTPEEAEELKKLTDEYGN